MINVIVNADDFGLDENRTMAILEAYREGWISTTTAIVTTSWFKKGIRLAEGSRLHQNIGLHLNLTEGYPLTENIRKSSIFCNPDGTFNAFFHNTKKYRLYLPTFEKNVVREEIKAQIDTYRQSGLACFHLDSHHHVHTDFSIARILLPLAVEAGFKTVRLSRNFGAGLTWTKKMYKCFINSRLSSYEDISLNANYFCNFEDLQKDIDLLPDDCTVEVMTHPLYSRNHQLDMTGELTEFHWDCRVLKDYWMNPPEKILLFDYNGALHQ